MVPRPLLLVYFTGLLEFMGAVGLLLPRFRSVAGICLIVLLIAIFPANVSAAMKGTTLAGKPVTGLWLRAPMQGGLYRSAVGVHASVKRCELRKDRVNHEDGFRSPSRLFLSPFQGFVVSQR